MSLQPAVDVKEKQMVEDGEKYLVVNGCCGGWEFDVKSSDEEEMNDDILKLQKKDSVGVRLRKYGESCRRYACNLGEDAADGEFQSVITIQVRVERWGNESSSC